MNKFVSVFKNPFVIAFLIGIASLHFVKEMSMARRSAPLPLVSVGEWALTSHDGVRFGSRDLNGKVVVANFFFTRCPTICPKLIEAMKEVRARFGEHEKIHFVSFSVDPNYDTPEILRAYREKNAIEFSNWTFLTGTSEEMVKVVLGQMKLHMGEPPDANSEAAVNDLFDISHVGELVLFDQNGDLRDKFPTEPVALASLVRSAKFLLEKGP